MLSILAEAALRSLLLGSLVWLGLKLCRVRNPQAQMTAWLIVLAASLAMPFVMHEPTVTLTVAEAPLQGPDPIWFAEEQFQNVGLAMPSDAGETAHAAAPGLAVNLFAPVDGWRVASAIYALVTGFLLLRLITGLLLTWRLVRAATPVDES